MDKIRAFPVDSAMFDWLEGAARPFSIEGLSISHDIVFIDPKLCYDECHHAMNNGCVEAHSYDDNPFAYRLMTIAKDNAAYGVEVVALYKVD